jgi:hypothetical protein
MSDSFAGLTRRINEFVHDRETSEELSHLLDEAKDHGGDAVDVLIELALGESYDDEELEGEGAELAAIAEDDELVDDDTVIGDDEEVDEEAIDADLAALEEGLDDEDDDLLGMDESAPVLELAAGEVLVL